MDVNMQNFIRENLKQGENVFWQGQANMRIFFKAELQKYFELVLIPLFIYFIIKMYDILIEKYLYFGYMIVIIFISIFDVFSWINRKRNTYFVITNKRALIVFKARNHFQLNDLSLDEIKIYEVKRNKNGGHLYLGKYKMTGLGHHFIYEYEITDSIGRDFQSFKSRIYTDRNYFSFFDIEDPETPARLIRTMTSAKEYIDPDKKIRNKYE